MRWGEAVRLTRQLATDPSSHVGAALAGWEHPVSREALVLMDLFDLQHRSKAKQTPDPYRRPWPDPNKKQVGTGTRLTPDEFKAQWKRLADDAEVVSDG